MKKLLLFLPCMFLLSLSAQPFLQINSQVQNVVEWEPVDFYSPHPAAHPLSSFRYFWYFDDGSFRLKDVEHAAGSDIPISDTLPSIGDYLARMEMTYIYSPPDTEDLKLGLSTFAVSVGTVGPSPPPNPVELYSLPLRLNPVRIAVPGDSTVYIITYEVDRNTCPQATMMVEYEETLMEYVASRYDVFHGENIMDLSGGQLEISLPASGKNNMFLGFDVNPDAEPGSENPVQAYIIDDNGHVCGEFYLVNGFIGKSYDPNIKVVSKDSLHLNPPQTLSYTVQFQNTGDGPTDSIRIQDVLDPRLDPATLSITDVRIGYQEILLPDNVTNFQSVAIPKTPGVGPSFSYKFEQVGATFIISLDSAALRGTKEAGYGFGFSENETIGQIEFEVMTYCFQDLGSTIENFADIYFDDNAPVRTDTARTHKLCCKQWVDQGAAIVLDPFTFVDTSRLAPPYEPDSLKLLSLSSDAAPISDRPSVKLDTTLTYVAGAYTGMDIATIRVCSVNPVLCDTIEIPICVGIQPGLFPCDETPCSALSIEPGQDALSGFWVYPNPARDILFLDYRDMHEAVEQLELLDLQGRKLREIVPDASGNSRLSIRNLPAGLYMIRVNQRYARKVWIR